MGARPGECAQAGTHPDGRLQPRAVAAQVDRRGHAPEPAGAGFSAIGGLMGHLSDCWERLTRSWASKWTRRRWSAQLRTAKPPDWANSAIGLLPPAANGGEPSSLEDAGWTVCTRTTARHPVYLTRPHSRALLHSLEPECPVSPSRPAAAARQTTPP